MKTVVRIAVSFALATAALVALPAASQAATSRAEAAEGVTLVGTWVGTYNGYVDGRYVAGDEKIIITKARGAAAKGTWQYRAKGKKWSAPLPVHLIVTADADGSIAVRGVDGEGVYDGELVSTDRLTFVYSDPQPELTALRLDLTRR